MEEVEVVINIKQEPEFMIDDIIPYEIEESEELQHGKRIKVEPNEVSKTKNTQEKNKLLPPCQCTKKCYEKISESQREKIHENYYTHLKTVNEKRLFVASHSHCVRAISFPNIEKRQYITYDFEINGKLVQVCRTFFLNTLGISSTTVKTALAKKGMGGTVLPDKRGHKEPPNKTPEEVINKIREHIQEFLKENDCYKKGKKGKKVVGSNLSISKMYSLLVEAEKKAGTPEEKIPKKWLYHKVFNDYFGVVR